MKTLLSSLEYITTVKATKPILSSPLVTIKASLFRLSKIAAFSSVTSLFLKAFSAKYTESLPVIRQTKTHVFKGLQNKKKDLNKFIENLK